MGVFALQTEDGTIAANRVRAATGWLTRAVGLLGRSRIEPGEGLWFPSCRSIHMMGMRTPLDIVFVDRAGTIVALRERLLPWRLASEPSPAWGVLELAPGHVRASGIQPGSRLTLISAL